MLRKNRSKAPIFGTSNDFEYVASALASKCSAKAEPTAKKVETNLVR